ncbi:MAG: oxidoreductase [Planctomycetes bacterium]|nr:oxidoreductase [Planctomycetota bacterium]
MSEDFRAIVLAARGRASSQVTRVPIADLPSGDVLVRVRFSSLNYKDGLAITGTAPVVRAFPMIPGIDFAGVVVESSNPEFHRGDEVVCTGWGMGETHWGGYAEYARVPAGWLVRAPAEYGMRWSMAVGTAGLTAMFCQIAMERHGLAPGSAVAVTGASGGVGSVACAILARSGYRVTAITGRMAEEPYLRGLGASEVIGRESISAQPDKTLLAERWAGAVDTAGGAVLAGLLRSIVQGGSVAACGLAASGSLPTTVYPFILRAVSLLGISSSNAPIALRREAWSRLPALLPRSDLEGMTTSASLDEVFALAPRILAGQVRGRCVIEVAAD